MKLSLFVLHVCRWAKNGPIACSFDGKRLFSAYRSGGIAAIFDPTGNGSVMGPHGKCVLNLRSATSTSPPVADILREDGSLIARHIKQKEMEVDDTEKEKLEWNFQGLLIEFLPLSWEVCGPPSLSFILLDHSDTEDCKC